MAEDVTIISYYRPKLSGTATGAPLGMVDADHLILILDRFSNGRVMKRHELKFADYAGLETEWDTGTATTVLNTSIDSEMSEIDWPAEPLTGNQRSFVGTTFDEAL